MGRWSPEELRFTTMRSSGTSMAASAPTAFGRGCELGLYRRYGGPRVDQCRLRLDVADDTIKVLAAFRQGIRARPDQFVLVATAADIPAAKASGRLAVSFDLEERSLSTASSLSSKPTTTSESRTMLTAYSQPNRAGGGCHGDPNTGLTGFGRAVVAEMEPGRCSSMQRTAPCGRHSNSSGPRVRRSSSHTRFL